MSEQAFRNIDNALRTDHGMATELDYTEQTSWLLFLRSLDALEQDKGTETALHGKPYDYIISEPYRWGTWAAPKGPDGSLDFHVAKIGDDLLVFVNDELFPYLQGFKAWTIAVVILDEAALLEQGVSLYEVSRMLGHSSIATTADIYGHLTTDMQQRAADRMDAVLAGDRAAS